MYIWILDYCDFFNCSKRTEFYKAAEQLNITTNTFKTASALEEELGTSLFIRGNRNITLTEAGILLKRRALEIIDLEEKNDR